MQFQRLKALPREKQRMACELLETVLKVSAAPPLSLAFPSDGVVYGVHGVSMFFLKLPSLS